MLTGKQAARAYYDIASSRFVDTTCQSIHIKLFMRCREELRGQIEKELGILDENGKYYSITTPSRLYLVRFMTLFANP